MPYHSNPIDDYGFLSSTKVVHFPKEPTMGYLYTPNNLNPYPPSVGVQGGGDPEEDCLPNNIAAFDEKWIKNKWSRFPKTPNIVFPAQGFNNVANITGYDSGFTRDESIKSWAMEFWIFPDGIQDVSRWSTLEASNKFSLIQLGSLVDGMGADYPYTLGSDALNVSLYYYDNAYPLIYWSMKTGDPNASDADDYKFEYIFDSSRILQINGWNHIVLEWHYGGIEADPADGWAAYYEGYDPTCRVWVNGFEAVRGLKQWPITVPGNSDDEVTDTPSYIGGNIAPAATTHVDCEGLPRTEIGYFGGRCQQHDAGKSGGWQSTGTLISSEAGRGFDALGSWDSEYDWVDYNFKGFLTEFRIWKNKRFTRSGFGNRNSTEPSNIPSAYSSQRLVGNEDGLVAYYPINEGEGKFLYDKTVYTNLPAMLLVTEKTVNAYPEDDNVNAIHNIRWDTPPEGLSFKESNDTQSVFIKQNKIRVDVEVDASNKVYNSDMVTFGESYDTITEPALTNFSFVDSKNHKLAPQIGDYLLLKWSIDPSCLKRDLLQTMTNIVTISLPYYREPYPIVLDLFNMGEEIVPPDPVDPHNPIEHGSYPYIDYSAEHSEGWKSVLEIDGLELYGTDNTAGLEFTMDSSNGSNYDLYKGFKSYYYNDTTSEAFENIFAADSINANFSIADFDYDDYYFILHLTFGNNRRRVYHSKNATSFMLNTRYRDNHTSSLWALINEASSPQIERSESEIKRMMFTRQLNVAFSGDGSVGSPHTLTLTTPNDDASNQVFADLKHARLEVYNKFSTITKEGALITTRPRVVFGPTPYGEVAFFKRERF